MIYLDYSATTIVDPLVLDSFNKATIDYFANPNSLHQEGVRAKRLINAAEKEVANILKVKENEVIFTSGATESNNLAIMGVVNKYKNRGKTIITTKLEHSSVLSTLHFLEKNGYIIKYVKVKDNGKIDLDNLQTLINDDTLLVSISEVNSETGLIQDVNEIGKILKKYPRIIFHVDGTQAVGKKELSLENIDLYSFSAHKIYGIKGIGCLIKKSHIELEPLIHGGKSQTNYRAGTPPVGLIVSLAKALKIATNQLEERRLIVQKLNKILINGLKKIDNVIINSNNNCVPHIVNISILNIKPETILHALEEENIYISTKTACSKESDMSLSVYELTKNEDKAYHSIRISLSHLTTESEITLFLKVLETKVQSLLSIKR